MPIVTVEDLARALVTRMGISEEDAEAHAEHVLDIFGFEEEIIDNVLEPEDRQLFYTMEAHGIVAARSEETTLHHGQDWRTHSWIMRAERVLAMAGREGGAEAAGVALVDVEDDAAVYRDLPATVWTRR